MAAETLANSPLHVLPGAGYAGSIIRGHLSRLLDTTVLEDGDIFQLGYTPKRALVFGGYLCTADLDTGTEALDIDAGWAAAGSATDTWTDPNTGITYTNAAASADPDGLCNCGVLTGDGVSEVYNAGVNYRAFVFPLPLYFSEKTMIQLEVNAAAGTQAAGRFSVFLDYKTV